MEPPTALLQSHRKLDNWRKSDSSRIENERIQVCRSLLCKSMLVTATSFAAPDANIGLAASFMMDLSSCQSTMTRKTGLMDNRGVGPKELVNS